STTAASTTKRSPRRARPAGSTSSIEPTASRSSASMKRPCSRSPAPAPRQRTAPTQPYPRGDAFVPQSIPIAPEGTTLVNGGKIFTPFWTTPTLVKPGPPGGVNWPPSSYDVGKGTLFVCAADRIWSYLSQEVTAERP